MKLIRFLLLCFFITKYTHIIGQPLEDEKWKLQTMYEYGIPLTSCESNLRNLFQNWPKWVVNSQDTELLSYKYIETLSDSTLLYQYAQRMHTPNSLLKSISKSYSIENTKVTEKGSEVTSEYFNMELIVNIRSLNKGVEELNLTSSQKNLYRLELLSHMNTMVDNFKKNVQLGDQVYLIKLKIVNDEYDHYVICRPSENRVIYDLLFLDIKVKKYLLDKLYEQN